MKIILLLCMLLIGSKAQASRVILGVLEEVESTSSTTAEGYRASSVIFCQNLSPVAQNIQVELLSESVKYYTCVHNQDSSISSIWVASGSCARVQTVNSTLAELAPSARKQSVNLAGGAEEIFVFDLGCIAKLNGLYCSPTDNSKWSQFNFSRVSERPKPNHCKTDTDVPIPNCVVAATATYRVKYRITVAEDRGAVLCSHTAKVYLAQSNNYEFGLSSKSVNGGRPF